MVEVFRIPKVKGGVARVGVEHVLELVDVVHGPGLAIDALDAETEQVDGLDALIDDHGHGQPVALVQLGQRHAENRP